MQVEASATYGSKHCLRHAVVTEPIDQSHDFSFIHKFYYENYYNETRAFMWCRYKYGPRTKVIKNKEKGKLHRVLCI